MNSILYIGEDEERLSLLKAQEQIALRTVKNVVGFYNNLENLHEVGMVISELNLKGLDGPEIFERYREELCANQTPFILVGGQLDRVSRQRYLNQGILDWCADKEQLLAASQKVEFYREFLGRRLSEHENKLELEYKIPIGKRFFDLLAAGGALLVLSPFLLLVALAIRLESKGKVYYISKRVGTGFRVFDFYKFRSMYSDADKRLKELSHLNQYGQEEDEEETHAPNKKLKGKKSSPTLIFKDGTPMSEAAYQELKRKQQAGTFVKFKNDPRVTKVGQFIRKTSIDELPQLINVLKGDMSIVGNRPLPLYEAEQLTSDDWAQRFLAPAGITGLWQVEKRGQGEMSEEERKALDNKYAQNFSLKNDIRLILKTIPALFQKENV